MSDGFQRSFVLKLSLEFLKRNDLSGRTGGDGKDLTKQCRTAHRAERQHITTDGWLNNGISNIGAPARGIVLKGNRTWIGPELDKTQRSVIGLDVKGIGNG